MGNGNFRLDYFSPTGFIGFWVLFIGLVFTGIMFYFVFFRLIGDEDSYKDKERKELAKAKQKALIERLYPKKIINENSSNSFKE